MFFQSFKSRQYVFRRYVILTHLTACDILRKRESDYKKRLVLVLKARNFLYQKRE